MSSFAKRFIGVENLPTRLSEFDVQQAFCLSKDDIAAIEDLNVNPKEYAIACLATTQLTMEGGGKSALAHDTGVGDSDWIPGDWGYVENTKFPAVGGTVGLEGENIIYTGMDRFWGHFGPGIEYKTLTQWFDQVKGWNGGAKIEDYRDRPKTGLE